MKTIVRYAKTLILAVIATFSDNAQGGQMSRIPETGSFVLQGKAANVPADKKSFRVAVTNLFTGDGFDVPFRDDGTFCRQLPVLGMQDMYLYLGDAVTVSVCAGDTIYLAFDFEKCPESIQLKASEATRTRELSLELELYRKFRKEYLDLAREGWKPGVLSDTAYLNKVKRYVDGYRSEVQNFESRHGRIPHADYLLYRGYFDGIRMASVDPNALSALFFRYNVRCFNGERSEKLPVYQSSDFNFFQSPSALGFARSYFYSRMYPLVSLWSGESVEEKWIRHLELAEAAIPDKSLRDWHEVAAFMSDVTMNRDGSVSGLKSVGEKILSRLTTPAVAEKMRQLSDRYFGQMSPGQPAPDFTLMNEEGQPVSLSDLKGKVVYMDIWAIGCGPCRKEFGMLEDLHKKYAAYEDRLAYVYVCIGSAEKEWKAALKKFGLKGYLLHAPTGKEKGFVAYNGDFFPLYVLIDHKGNIAEYNSPLRPSVLLEDKPNLLDELLNAF